MVEIELQWRDNKFKIKIIVSCKTNILVFFWIIEFVLLSKKSSKYCYNQTSVTNILDLIKNNILQPPIPVQNSIYMIRFYSLQAKKRRNCYF